MVTRRTSYFSRPTASSTYYQSSVTSPYSREQSPTGADWDADDEGPAMSGDESVPLRTATASASASSHSATHTRRPTLQEILANTSGPPWTLTAFMAYLSTNHCLETLEFTMDAGRYKKHYQKMMGKAAEKNKPPSKKDIENMKVLWQRLIDAYIRPNGSREVNIPSEVRDPILNLDTSTDPPVPESLDLAVAKVYELMEDSVLVPFLNDLASQSPQLRTGSNDGKTSDDDSRGEDRSRWRRSRQHKQSPPPASSSHSHDYHSGSMSPSSVSGRKSASSLTNPFKSHRFSTKVSPTSSGAASSAAHTMPVIGATTSAGSDGPTIPGLTDDSGEASSPTNESPMTPPTSPPESEFGTSPRHHRDSGAWKSFGRLSQWKPMRKKSQNFRPHESMP